MQPELKSPVEDRPRRGPVALRNRDFRRLWAAGMVSTAGTQMQQVAVTWHVFLLTGSPLALGLLGLFKALPLITLALAGGVVADSRDRRRMLLGTQCVLMGVSAVLAVATYLDVAALWLLYGAVAVASATTAFDNPARAALVPALVPEEDLPNALSLNVVAWQTATVVGPSLAGIVIATAGVQAVYAIDAVSFVAVLAAISGLRPREREGAAPRPGVAAIREGLEFVFRTPIMTATMFLDFFATLFGTSMTMMPIFATSILNVGAEGLGLLYAAPSVGAVAAGAVLSLVGTMRRFGAVVLGSVAVYGAAIFLFGVSTWLPASLLALALAGASDSVSTVARQTIRQLVTPDSLRGRMTSVNMVFFMGGPLLGEFRAGVIADILTPAFSVASGGLGVIVTVALAALSTTLRRFRR